MTKSPFLFLAALCAFVASPAECAVAGDRAYSVGQNLLANPDFARNNGVDADGWEHFVQFGTNAVMRIVRVEGQPGVCQAAEMFFTSRDRAVQTRYKQPVPFETNTVYELEYSYQSEMDGALYADVMMTGTGPMYRSFPNIPSAKWTRVRRLFATPDQIQTIEDKIFLFQNRSMVPIRYANGSIRATDIKPEDVGRYQPSLSVHSVTGDDQLILPGGVKKTADFVIHTDCTRPDVRYEAFYINGTNGVFDVAVSNLSCHVPMDAITEGKTTLYMAMKDGDVLINWATVVIERIAESAMPKGNLLPSSPKCVVDPSGKPMVVIGMYCIDDEKSDWPMVELRRNGFNTLQSYAATGSWKNPGKIDALLERARVNKMWLHVSTTDGSTARDNYNASDVYDLTFTFQNSTWIGMYVETNTVVTLTYDVNGGEDAPDAASWAPNATDHLSSTEPTRAGYEFAGWNEEEDGSGATTYNANGVYTMPLSNTTLYAQWTPITLTFNATATNLWNNSANWSPACVPTIEHDVVITKPVEVNVTDARAKSVVLDQYSDNTGSLTISAGKELAIAGTLRKKDAEGATVATAAADITIGSDEDGNGALVMGTHDGTNEATVNFYTLSHGAKVRQIRPTYPTLSHSKM